MKRPLQITLAGQLVVHPLASWLSTKILQIWPKNVDNQLARGGQPAGLQICVYRPQITIIVASTKHYENRYFVPPHKKINYNMHKIFAVIFHLWFGFCFFFCFFFLILFYCVRPYSFETLCLGFSVFLFFFYLCFFSLLSWFLLGSPFFFVTSPLLLVFVFFECC